MKTKLAVLCTLALSLVAGAETSFNPLNVGGIGAVVGVTHDELNAAVAELEAKDAQLSATLGNVQQRKADKATTLSGYDIGDAYIQDSTIYLGSQSLRPLLYTEGYISGNTVYLRGTSRTFLTQHQSLANYATVASVNTLAGRVTTAEGNISSLTTAKTQMEGRLSSAEEDISGLWDFISDELDGQIDTRIAGKLAGQVFDLSTEDAAFATLTNIIHQLGGTYHE